MRAPCLGSTSNFQPFECIQVVCTGCSVTSFQERKNKDPAWISSFIDFGEVEAVKVSQKIEMNRKPTIGDVPEEVMIEVFGYLSPKLLKVAALVCKK